MLGSKKVLSVDRIKTCTLCPTKSSPACGVVEEPLRSAQHPFSSTPEGQQGAQNGIQKVKDTRISLMPELNHIHTVCKRSPPKAREIAVAVAPAYLVDAV